MRSLAEAKSRWEVLAKYGGNTADLRRAIKFNGPESPCVAGLRSVCWKTFLLFQNSAEDRWLVVLRESRSAYSALSERYLQYIKHPELLASLSSDPLADDADSPWNSIRLDDVVRAEILQDVQRLPDEPLYREEATQKMILDILFIYCKMNPDVGGYRQGMHELLAPFVYVLFEDAIDRAAVAESMSDDASLDPTLSEMCDAAFIEHDAFALFSKLMMHAKPFYETGDQSGFGPEQNTIVEKSKQIHEVALLKVDPELSDHLTSIEVLPQIFLIRWIRLLFSREFPLDRLLVLWDTIFAFDPSLSLIDLICVAMLLRIRWTLLEADYSGALQLLLKYPAPDPPYGPHTFVDDALFLRHHLNAAGGANLILKYTGKGPTVTSTDQSGSQISSMPTSGLLSQSLRQRTLGSTRASLRPLSQAGGVEALFQGAAKGMLERGEKLGINQAVREAVGEIRRNVQGLQTSVRNSPAFTPSGMPSVALMERRNRQLSLMLDETVSSLKELAGSNLEERDKVVEVIELAAAKMQFVKVYLEDSTLAVPSLRAETPGSREDQQQGAGAGTYKRGSVPTVALDTTEVTTTTAVENAMAALSMPSSPPATDQAGVQRRPPAVRASPTPKSRAPPTDSEMAADRMDTDGPEAGPGQKHGDRGGTVTTDVEVSQSASSPIPLSDNPSPQPLPSTPTTHQDRPKAPIPTRSTLAQSSFAWMLEPDASPSSTTAPFPSPPTAQQQHQQQQQQQTSQAGGSGQGPLSSSSLSLSSSQRSKRRHNNVSRERNAFLFGEVTADGDAAADGGLSADRIFGLQPIRKQ